MTDSAEPDDPAPDEDLLDWLELPACFEVPVFELFAGKRAGGDLGEQTGQRDAHGDQPAIRALQTIQRGVSDVGLQSHLDQGGLTVGYRSVVVEEPRGLKPGAELRDEDRREHRTPGERAGQRQGARRAPHAPGAAISPGGKVGALRADRREHVDAGGCVRVEPESRRELGKMAEQVQSRKNHRHDEADLWTGSRAPREEGPSNSSSTPLTNTTIVERTTIGASIRSGAGGGPLRR